MGQFFDPWAYVISKNLLRRHLTPDQRADILAEVYARTKKQGHRTSGQNAQKSVNTRAAMAKEGRLPERKLRTAIQVRKDNPDLAAKVRSGEVTYREIKAAEKAAQRKDRLLANPQRLEGINHVHSVLWDIGVFVDFIDKELAAMQELIASSDNRDAHLKSSRKTITQLIKDIDGRGNALLSISNRLKMFLERNESVKKSDAPDLEAAVVEGPVI
jgi:hypothetical protein